MKPFLACFMVWALLLGGALDAKAMEQASASPKPNVQHMKIMTKSSEGIIIADTWQDVLHKHTRIDIIEYVLADEAVTAVNQHRWVVLNQNEKMLEVSRSRGKEENINRDILDPYNIRNNKNRLFEATVRWYGGARWERTGTIMLNGSEVHSLKRLYKKADGQTAVNRAYIDPDTGLPIKEEYDFGESGAPTITKMYLFEEVSDPEGYLFTSAASSLLDGDAAHWFRLALDAVMPLDDALNHQMKYIAVDMDDIPGLDDAAKKQVLRSLEKHQVKTLEASLAQLQEKGLFNRERGTLEGPLLRINKMTISEEQVILDGFKYRAGNGAIGFKVILKLENGQWKVQEALPMWVS